MLPFLAHICGKKAPALGWISRMLKCWSAAHELMKSVASSCTCLKTPYLVRKHENDLYKHLRSSKQHIVVLNTIVRCRKQKKMTIIYYLYQTNEQLILWLVEWSGKYSTRSVCRLFSAKKNVVNKVCKFFFIEPCHLNICTS